MKHEKIELSLPFPSLLLLAFIVLKLCGVITWSWWWVLAPLWIPVALLGAWLLFIGVFWVCAMISLKLDK
jgi:hypothetical protein